MDDTLTSSAPVFTAETVAVGERSSRLSSAIVAILFVIPVFATLLFGGVDNATWVFVTVFCLAIVCLWAADSWKGSGLLLNTSMLQLPLIGLIGIGLIQLLPLGPGGSPLSMDPFATRFFLTHLAVYILFFASCLTFINSEKRLRKAVVLVIIFGAVMAFIGILQRLATPESIYGLRGTRQGIPFGPFVNEHHFAAFMEMTSGVALGLLFGRKTKRDKRVLLAFAVVIMGIAVVFTSSRGGVLGLVSVIAFVAILSMVSGRRERDKQQEAGARIQGKLALAGTAAALVLIMLGSVLLLGGDQQLFRGIGATQVQQGVSNGRAHIWSVALKVFLDHPFLGAGFDAFGVAFTRYDTWSGLLRVEQAHNDYLQTLADAGIVGFVCIAAFLYLLFRKALKTIGGAQGFRRDAAVGALAGCFGLLIHSFFDFPLRTPSNAFFFLMLCALAVVPIRSDETERRRRRSSSTAP
jgi:O-antigen ligase